MLDYEYNYFMVTTPAAREYAKRVEEEAKSRQSHLSKEQRAFFDKSDLCLNSGKLLDALIDALDNGVLPSVYIAKNMEWIFGTYILPRHRNAVLWAVDHCIDWPYTGGLFRPTIRSRRYRVHCLNIVNLLHDFYMCSMVDFDLCDILEQKLPLDALEYINSRDRGYCPALIAYELDSGNSRLEGILNECILGYGYLHRRMIEGIVKSSNPRLHQALGKLLLAAELQEGLRQAICERADLGTIGAFFEIWNVIEQNNLIRYSSIRRAIGTWTGLITEESSKIERINEKIVPLLSRCLRDGNAREECLNSTDSMHIHAALFATGFYCIEDVHTLLCELMENGTAHQVLTAGYYASSMQYPWIHSLAKAAILRFPERKDIIAVYLKEFINTVHKKDVAPERLTEYFNSREEACRCYDILMQLNNRMKKNTEMISPCIFPWYAVNLERGMLVYKLSLLSLILDDAEKIDLACRMIPQCLPELRSRCATLLLKNPVRPAQFAALCACLGDREKSTRQSAFQIANNLPIETLDIRMLEDLLRMKSSDLRMKVITLLMRQTDDRLADSIRRLHADKKEEKRCAAYDLMLQTLKEDARASLKFVVIELCQNAAAESARERILLDRVRELLGNAEPDPVEALFSEADAYNPQVSIDSEDLSVFLHYFPDSSLGENASAKKYCPSCKQAMEDLESLSMLIEAHKEDSFQSAYGQTYFLGYDLERKIRILRPDAALPFSELWNSWYDRLNSPERCLRAFVVSESNGSAPALDRLYGAGYNCASLPGYMELIRIVLYHLVNRHLPKDTLAQLARVAGTMIVNDFSDAEFALQDVGLKLHIGISTILSHPQAAMLLIHLLQNSKANFQLRVAMYNRCKAYYYAKAHRQVLKELESYGFPLRTDISEYLYPYGKYTHDLKSGEGLLPTPETYLRYWFQGAISERTLLYYFFRSGQLCSALEVLTTAQCLLQSVPGRRGINPLIPWRITRLLGHREATQDDQAFIHAVSLLADKVISAILEVELKRGDSETPYSPAISGIQCIRGTTYFARILAALGKDTLVRNIPYEFGCSKRTVMSHLLLVSAPAESDDVQALRRAVEKYGLSKQRLIEAAMYAPAWVDLIGAYLEIPGFASAAYYFMAHMNEVFDARRMARISQFTPLTAEELNKGAFDLQWFYSAHDQLGDDVFDQLYDAAKYISDGARHIRARKYADAALGKMNVPETEAQIHQKRNLDLLMAYSLIPLQGDQDLLRRYLFIQDFMRQSKQFGGQRIANEKRAGQMALINLASNAHIPDVTRLTLRMEAQLMEDNRDLFEPHEVDDVVVWIQVDVRGSASILCEKAGKPIKSIPARLKKDPYILRIVEAKKAFAEQYRRAKRLFEEAMEEETSFTVSEIALLMTNPVAHSVLKSLVFGDGCHFGRMENGALTDVEGHTIQLDGGQSIFVAHPVHLQKANVWTAWQRKLFAEQCVQPFKQVFRELYVKTKEELGCTESMRYSGNQIQPNKVIACLKARRWIADPEMGLQKIYYKENVIVNLYAQADWFTPADAEAPTLEWVAFANRKTHQPMKIEELPDVLFSEVMRDVDLAISVAHAGQVDPETSHSTIEMRAALLQLTLPMLGLENVRIVENRAIIEGSLGNYAIHLGSGVIHRQGGATICVLPVHSQHRGRIFLPFADDDPKTAEILSKVILFAEDKKIKDPSILEQLR